MAGLAIVIPRNGPGTGPTLPEPLHPYGATDASHRYVANRLVGALGDTVQEFPDQIGTAHLLPVLGGPSELVVGDGPGGGKALHRPDKVLTSTVGGVLRAEATSAPKSVVLVYEKRSTATARLVEAYASGWFLSRAGNGRMQLTASTGGSGLVQPGADALGWHVAIASLDNGQAAISLDGGAVVSGAITPGSGTSGPGVFMQTTQQAPNAIAEVVLFDRVLAASEHAAIYAALKQHYTVLP